MKYSPNHSKLIITGIALLVAFHYPVISLFSFEKTIFGIPQLFLYILILWVLAIGFIIRITLNINHKNQERDDE